MAYQLVSLLATHLSDSSVRVGIILMEIGRKENIFAYHDLVEDEVYFLRNVSRKPGVTSWHNTAMSYQEKFDYDTAPGALVKLFNDANLFLALEHAATLSHDRYEVIA